MKIFQLRDIDRGQEFWYNDEKMIKTGEFDRYYGLNKCLEVDTGIYTYLSGNASVKVKNDE